MLGSRLCLAAVALGTAACVTTVSECQKILMDLTSNYPDCAEYCDFYGNRFPLPCYGIDLVECILRKHPEQCAEDPVYKCQTTLTDLSSDFKRSCDELCDWYGNKYPQICGDVNIIDCILQWHSDQCVIRTTTTTPTTTTKYIYEGEFPVECVTAACEHRVQSGLSGMGTKYCQKQCKYMAESDLCPQATSGEQFLMQCMKDHHGCGNLFPKDRHFCNFDKSCVLAQCGFRVKHMYGDDKECRDKCKYYYENPPSDCRDLKNEADDALAECVAKYERHCTHEKPGQGTVCRPYFSTIDH